jgi:uncharacterized phage protein (TIGR02220 family)
MSMTFTKLFSSITESTIWTEDHPTRLTWITMLAMADRKGRVWASIPGLANRARVTVAEAENAIHKFLSPDKYSRTEDNGGRRIEPIDGGWRLLNHEKYRSIRDEEVIKESKRKYINTRRELERNVENVDRSRANAEADTEAEADTLPVVISNKPLADVGQKPDVAQREKNKITREESKQVLQFLNLRTGKAYREVDANLKPIESILKSGVSLQDMKTVTMRKVHDWQSDPKMSAYLRPSTLYRRSNFEQYFGQTIIPEELENE